MSVHRRKEALFAFALIVGLAGCASTGGGRPPGATADRIVQEEFLEVGDVDGYLAIQRLRSAWLRVRNQVEPPVVYVNGARWGYLEQLSSIRARGIALAERINATDATTRFGTGHTGGAILITMSGL
jgi:hypothetical protein